MGNDLPPTVAPEVGQRQAKHVPHEIRSQHIDGACAGTREEIADLELSQGRRRIPPESPRAASTGGSNSSLPSVAMSSTSALVSNGTGIPAATASNEAAMAPACARQWGRK